VAVIAIFVLLPFATPLTVFLGTKLNHLSLFKVWKEIAMVIIGILVLLSGLVARFRDAQHKLLRVLLWLMVAYGAWTILLGLVDLLIPHQINWAAFIYALIVNLRFLFFFALCWLVCQESPVLAVNWRKLVLIPAMVVVGFGVLQHYVLPNDFLTHFGYGPHTITAYQTVDQKPDYVRLQSTLRGPNPLGAYLVVIITALLVGFRKQRRQQAVALAATLVVMFYTYSRSAWAGMVVAVASLAYISITSLALRKWIAVAGAAIILLFGAGVYLGRHNSVVENTVFHTDSTSRSPESSNAGRLGALERGVQDVAHEPFGRGPGSAGPASLRNDHPERIAENYYLQIGQEVGWIGLGLFLAINAVISLLLWQQRKDPLARVLLASFLGLVIVNMVSHGWTDDTLSLLWWGMAGVALAPLASRAKTKRPARTNTDG
jgi:O-antigen ligase